MGSMATEWYNTEGEWEMVNDNGFIFKRRKRHRDADVAPLAMKDGQPEEDAKRVAKVTSNLEKKRQMLLTTKARYLEELNAWEKLAAAAAAAAPPSAEDVISSSHTSPLNYEYDPKAEFLTELKIEVENVEEYVKQLQENVILAETTYKLCVKDIRDDVNFRPANELVNALTAQAPAEIDTPQLPAQTSLDSTMSLTSSSTS